MYITAFGKIRVIRDCGYLRAEETDDNKECVRRLGTHEVQATYCSCTKDVCNDAVITHPVISKSMFALMSIAIGAALYRRLN